MITGATLPRALTQALRAGLRLFGLRRAGRDEFSPVPELFAVLVVLDLALLLGFSLILVGMHGQLNYYELPRALMFVPLVLTLGLVASRLERDGALLRLPVAMAAIGVTFTAATSILYLLAYRGWLPFLELYWSYFDYVALGWATLVVTVACVRLSSGAAWARASVALAGVALVVMPSWWMPVGMIWAPQPDPAAGKGLAGFHVLAQEEAFYAQHHALERALAAVEPERPGVPDVYVLAAGLYAGEDVFMKEIRMIAKVMSERFDARGRTVTLINNPRTIHEHPIASMTSIRGALSHLGTLMNTEEDVLVLYVSSHGSDTHELVVDFRPLNWTPVTPKALRLALDQSGIRWRVLVISACHSGGFIEALKDERTMVITASSADRQSFGCGHLSDATYLAQALFGEALKKTHAFEAAFELARARIETWEREQGFAPSRPQLHAGAGIRAKLAEVERRLAAPAK